MRSHFISFSGVTVENCAATSWRYARLRFSASPRTAVPSSIPRALASVRSALPGSGFASPPPRTTQTTAAIPTTATSAATAMLRGFRTRPCA